jgi:hypothetical protein
MGYSYYLVARDTESRDKMLQFLQSRIPEFEAIHPDLACGLKSNWVDWMYARKKDRPQALGFEVISSDDIHYFHLEILKWAARHVGKRIHYSRIQDAQPSAELLPYIVYDGAENLTAGATPSLIKSWEDAEKRYPTMVRYFRDKSKLWDYAISIQELQALTDQMLADLEKDWLSHQVNQLLAPPASAV